MTWEWNRPGAIFTHAHWIFGSKKNASRTKWRPLQVIFFMDQKKNIFSSSMIILVDGNCMRE